MGLKERLWRYQLPLLQPLTSSAKLKVREGILIAQEDDHGTLHLADLCPLPGLHRESLEEAFAAFREDADCSMPSVRFARSCLKLPWPLQKTPFAVPVNALLNGDVFSICEQAESYQWQGYTSFKLKVGRKNMRDDIACVKALRKTIDQKAEIRLDANCAWSLFDALAFADSVAASGISYIEEPLQYSEMWQKEIAVYAQKSPLTLALDEHFAQGFDAKVWVLKPNCIGSHEEVRAVHQMAVKHGIQVVISASFESAVGIVHLTHLAYSLGLHHAHGLGSVAFFAQDVLHPPLRVSRGLLQVGVSGVSTTLDACELKAPFFNTGQ